MKVTSADCKVYIVEAIHPETKASDWKRRSKSKRDDGAVLRVFWNTETNDSVGVIEENGEITGAQQEESQAPAKPEIEALYHYMESEEEPGFYELYFGTVSDWTSRGCQTDTGIDEVCDVMSKLGIYEDAENFYLIPEDQFELVKETLERVEIFGMRDDFSAFIEDCGQ
jgi:hypothetical protein